MDVVSYALGKKYTDKRSKAYPKTVIFGDSITAQNGDISTVGYRFFGSAGYFTWANILTGGKMDLVKNAGISGDSTTKMLARMMNDVISFNPDLVIIFGGTNDIAIGYEAEVTISNLTKMYETMKAKGIKMVLCTVLPRTEFTPSNRESLWKVNNFIKNYALDNPNCILCDWYSTIVDSDGISVRADMTKDGTHPTILGAYRMGAKLASVLNFPTSRFISQSPDDKRNLLTNGCLSGNVSGKATGWSITSSATIMPSKELIDDGIEYYNKQVIVCTDDTVQVDFYQNIPSGFTAGDIIQGIAEVDLSDVTSIAGMNIMVSYLKPALTTLGRSSQNISTYDFTGIPVIFSGGILKTPKLVIPSDAQSLRFFFSAKMKGTVKLKNMTLYNYGQ